MAERALVTGASGFIGSQLIRRLLHDGAAVVALVRSTSDLWRIEDVLDWIELARDGEGVPQGGLDVVYHLAASGVRHGEEAAQVVETNVVGTLRALELARAAGAHRFVYCGSCFEYGPGQRLSEAAPLRPISAYGASKAGGGLLAEAYSQEHGLPVSWVRPFTAYGPFEAAYRLVPSAIVRALDREPLELTSGSQTRDFVYVEDVVEGIVAVAHSEAAVGGRFNLCTGVSTTVVDVAKTVGEFVGDPVELRVGALPDRSDDFAVLSGDPLHTAESLGWQAAVLLREGLARTIDWFRERRDRYPEYRRQATRR